MKTDGWTYGAEHELADWDQRRSLPAGYGVDREDVTMVNSTGIAVDPRGRTWSFGGEVQTAPTATPAGQAAAVDWLARHLQPAPTVNYRSNLHIHIRVPGLRDDLAALKRLQRFNAMWLPRLLPLVEPIPRPVPTQADYLGALRRYRRRCVSHHTVLPATRVAHQLAATTVEAFLTAEVPQDERQRPLWFLQPRAAVNLRQLRETDTIEFRHFAGTLGPEEVLTCVEWCRDYLQLALAEAEADPVLYWQRCYWRVRRFPTFPVYDDRLERRYRLTCHDGTLTRDQIQANIAAILAEDARAA